MKMGSIDVWRGADSNSHSHQFNVRRRWSVVLLY
jgi:hypothetical protein